MQSKPQFTLPMFFFLLCLILFSTACQTPYPNGATQNPATEAQTITASGDSILFAIDPALSEARFLITEELFGQEKTVVGRSSLLSGQIAVDFANPPAITVGPVQIDMRTLITDNAFRNSAIQNRILLTSLYEFVTFTPTKIDGLPVKITVGEPVNFKMSGDLTITAYTHEVVFDVTAVAISETKLEGSATANIQRADYDLVVPSATGVANVGEIVTLELDFVAQAVENP